MNTLILAVCFNVLMFALVIGGLIGLSHYLPPNASIITVLTNTEFAVVAILAVAITIIILNRVSRLKEVQ